MLHFPTLSVAALARMRPMVAAFCLALPTLGAIVHSSLGQVDSSADVLHQAAIGWNHIQAELADFECEADWTGSSWDPPPASTQRPDKVRHERYARRRELELKDNTSSEGRLVEARSGDYSFEIELIAGKTEFSLLKFAFCEEKEDYRKRSESLERQFWPISSLWSVGDWPISDVLTDSEFQLKAIQEVVHKGQPALRIEWLWTPVDPAFRGPGGRSQFMVYAIVDPAHSWAVVESQVESGLLRTRIEVDGIDETLDGVPFPRRVIQSTWDPRGNPAYRLDCVFEPPRRFARSKSEFTLGYYGLPELRPAGRSSLNLGLIAAGAILIVIGAWYYRKRRMSASA